MTLRPPNEWYVREAQRRFHKEGLIEVGDGATVSVGSAPGAWVAAFVRVPDPPNGEVSEDLMAALKGLTALLRPHNWFYGVLVEVDGGESVLAVHHRDDPAAVVLFSSWAGYRVRTQVSSVSYLAPQACGPG